MVKRSFWLSRIESAWRNKPIIWLSGVRRVGKTSLCLSVPGSEYFDCERPGIRRQLEDVEAFLDRQEGRRLILDEAHRLPNPTELLKVAADHYPTTRILATGSSTLGLSHKFRDTLTGRRALIWLTPLMSRDLAEFGSTDLRHRLLHGGLPPLFLADGAGESEFQDWMDAYWSKDILSLFRLAKRDSFLKFVEMVLSESGSLFEATRYARACEVSRPTILNYLQVLRASHVAHVLRPFSTRRSVELVSAPKVYGFDTGFVCTYKGWLDLREQDLGLLWEHFILNEINAHALAGRLFYWRDKQGHEVDFVYQHRGRPPFAIECKWSDRDAGHDGLAAFAKSYPQARCRIVSHRLDRAYERRDGDVRFLHVGLADLVRELLAEERSPAGKPVV